MLFAEYVSQTSACCDLQPDIPSTWLRQHVLQSPLTSSTSHTRDHVDADDF